RFDLLLCMGPPLLQEKLTKMASFKGPKPSLNDDDLKKAKDVIEKHKTDRDVFAQLELLTFGEFGDFLESIANRKVWDAPEEAFRTLFSEFQRHAVLNLKDLDLSLLDRIERGEKLDEEEKRKAKEEWIGRYYFDRNESRIH